MTTAVTALGVLILVVGWTRALLDRENLAGHFGAATLLGLEFFLAAGLLRLSSADTFSALGLVAAIVVLRRLLALSLKRSVRALHGSLS